MDPTVVVDAEVPETRAETAPQWSWSDLKRPLTLLAAVSGFVVSGSLAVTVSCNVHEFGHVVVAGPLGWEVERINLCLPIAGSVEYSRIGNWAGNAQGYAGGFIAAIFLASVYILVFVRRRLAFRSPGWWFAGLGVMLWVGPQVILGILEGTASPGENYGDLFRRAPSVYVPLIVLSILAGAAVHAWRWKAVFRVPPR